MFVAAQLYVLILFALTLFCALSFVGLIFLALRIGGAGKLRFKAAHCFSRLETVISVH